mmetsp:Transcript_6448/g.22016  ORF Transcript_6448/g.22016 Transcript_6448/m.22016 type:complete len:209 (+) Transcript_6448:2-628(+)
MAVRSALCAWIGLSLAAGAGGAAAGPDPALRAMQLPFRPHASLEAAAVVEILSQGLQDNGRPGPDAGLRRLYEFAHFECRKALTARRGGGDPDRFVRYADSPAVTTLLHSRAFTVGEPTLIPATQTRGELAALRSDVWGWDSDGGEEDEGPRAETGPARAPGAPRALRWVLERARHPGPCQGCFLVKELVLLEHMYLFAGDSGGTTTD